MFAFFKEELEARKTLEAFFYSYNIGQKVLRILLFLTHRRPTLQFGTMVTAPPTPPRSMLFSRRQKCSGHLNIVFWGEDGSIFSEPGFRGKYSKIKHTTCIFLNIFVQDCRVVKMI